MGLNLLVCIILVLHYFSTLLISFYFLLTVHTFRHIFAHSHSPVCMCLIFLTIILLFFLPPSELSPFKSPPSFPLFQITLLYTKPIHITSIYITSIYITLIHIPSFPIPPILITL
ncbi:hypothetical protein BJV74DRAFT_873118 [Russula compacta]|nr:hypothetical protein BJV74DRAFT_873118 [Russula compacta]